MAKIEIGDLERTIHEELTLYSNEITKELKIASDEVMKNLVKNTKKDANRQTGSFAKAITSKRTQESSRSRINTWYVKTPEYRKAHLLEKGHAKRNGGRTKAYGFIRKNEEIAEQEYVKKIEEIVKK